MNTRSRAKAEQEVRRTIEKQRRIERRERFATRDNVVTPYKLRSTMGRKGDNSTKATHSRSKRNVDSIEKADVAPIRLFSVGEENTSVDNEEIQVWSGYITVSSNSFNFYESPYSWKERNHHGMRGSYHVHSSNGISDSWKFSTLTWSRAEGAETKKRSLECIYFRAHFGEGH